MDNRKIINDVPVHLFNEILQLEEEAIITEEYKDITNNDMHIIKCGRCRCLISRCWACGAAQHERRGNNDATFCQNFAS